MKSIPNRLSLFLVVVLFVVTTNGTRRDNTNNMEEEWRNNDKLKLWNLHRSLISFGDIVDTITGGGGNGGNSISSFSDVCNVLINGSTGDAALDAVEECSCDSTLTSMSSKCSTTQEYCSEEGPQQQTKVCFEKDGTFEMGISFITSGSSAKSCVTLAEGTTTTTSSTNDLIGKQMCLFMDLDLGAMMNNNNESSNQLPINSCSFTIEGKSCSCNICPNKEGMELSCNDNDDKDYVTCETFANQSSSDTKPTDGLSQFKRVGSDVAKVIVMNQPSTTTTTPTPAPSSTSQTLLLATTTMIGTMSIHSIMNLL